MGFSKKLIKAKLKIKVQRYKYMNKKQTMRQLCKKRIRKNER